MGKRRRYLKPGGPRKQYTSTKQTRMLNIHRETEFKYHLNQVMDRSEIKDEQRTTFVANVVMKAARNSIADAKEYVLGIGEEGLIEPEVVDRIYNLLDRYATHR